MTLNTHIEISSASNSLSALEITILTITHDQGIRASSHAICGRIENPTGRACQTVNLSRSEALSTTGITLFTLIVSGIVVVTTLAGAVSISLIVVDQAASISSAKSAAIFASS